MQAVSITEATNCLDVIMDMAQKDPVLIERNGKPAVIMVSVEEYQKGAADKGKEDFIELCSRLRDESVRNGMTGEILEAILAEPKP